MEQPGRPLGIACAGDWWEHVFSRGSGAVHQWRRSCVGGVLRTPDRDPRAPPCRRATRGGGWNCEAPKSTRSSFHTTICVLEGLLEYERAVGPAPEVVSSRRMGEEYLLQRALFRRLSTGEIANPEFLVLAFPPRCHYDVLRGLDYFRAAGLAPDARVGDAVRVIESKRQADGRWLLDARYDEGIAAPSGERVGEPSRWNTLRALRVIRWYERSCLEQKGKGG